MSKFFHTKRAINSVTADTEQVGYEAGNVALEAIGHPWYAEDATAHTVAADIDSATVQAIMVSDVNFESAVVKNAADATIGTLTTYPDKVTGRRRGILVGNFAATTAIKLDFSGTPTDGLGYWRIGALYIYGAVVELPKEPAVGASYKGILANLQTELPNKKIAKAVVGFEVLELRLPFVRESAEDGLHLQRQAKRETVGLCLELDEYPELDSIPVGSYEGAMEAFLGGPMTGFDLVLREIA